MKSNTHLKKYFLLINIIINSSLFCQTPNLGWSSTFAIFTAIGAIDNIGATTITGDIGTNTGAFNGFLLERSMEIFTILMPSVFKQLLM